MEATSLADVHVAMTEWLRDVAMPFWLECGIDKIEGGFFERLTPGGPVPGEPRRSRLVARQIYVFAQAHRFGWLGDLAAEAVDHGLSFLETGCIAHDHSVRITAKTHPGIENDEYDLYDVAFVLFSLAEVVRLWPQKHSIYILAASIRDKLVERWKHPGIGFERARPPALPLEANPHMHLFEAFLAWSEVLPEDDAWASLADEIALLGYERLVDPSNGALREFWNYDWSPMPGIQGRIVEPGHQFEWGWLLLRWAEKAGSEQARAAGRRLIEIGETHGISDRHDMAICELWDDLTIKDDYVRLWPQTERLKAHLSLARRATDESVRRNMEERAIRAGRGLLPFLYHAEPGLWYDAMDQAGRFIDNPTKASSLYHIVCAYGELHAHITKADRAHPARLGRAG